VRHVHAGYGDSQVLHDLSFSVAHGRMLALLGRNGVGKTTCINAIIGFLRPSSGEIRLYGEAISQLAPEQVVARGIGLVPQGRRIFPTLTVRENLTVAAWASRQPDRPEWNLDRVFELFPRLEERQSNLGGSLSGGELQMLAIGRALMTNPRVLLLDEPSEGLAPLMVHELGAILGQLKRQSLAMVIVEQNSAMALDIADEALILGSARVDFRGSASDLKSNLDLLHRHLGVA